ncbi:hypothetical protein, partial [Priestia megaterium]|uniref:hypothetical protein n=1 Tax=Priestia megaterium TaxID=1404 RepID=UPI0035B5E4A1
FALATGGLLFSVKPDDYLANAAWRWKMALLLLALAAVAIQHANPAFKAALQGGPLALGVRATAFASAGLWLGVLVAG